MLSVRDSIRRRQPIERPLDIVGLELLVTVTQALLVGILLSLAAQLGGDARAAGLPIPGLLAVLGIAVGIGWLRWLVGGSGWLMASVAVATAILTGALWLLSLQDQALPRVDPLVGLLAAACAIYGLVAGAFLDGPHRVHWKGGVSQPRRGVPQTRATPARFSPPVQKVVDQRLADVDLRRISRPSLARLSMPTVKRPTHPETPSAVAPVADGLAVAAEIAPQTLPGAVALQASPTTATPVPSAVVDTSVIDVPDAALSDATTHDAADASAPAAPIVDPEAPDSPAATAVAAPATDTPTAAAPAPATASTTDLDATEVVDMRTAQPDVPPQTNPTGDATRAESAAAVEASASDPDAPTQPIARPAPQWPRPIEPRGHTSGHKVDPQA